MSRSSSTDQHWNPAILRSREGIVKVGAVCITRMPEKQKARSLVRVKLFPSVCQRREGKHAERPAKANENWHRSCTRCPRIVQSIPELLRRV